MQELTVDDKLKINCCAAMEVRYFLQSHKRLAFLIETVDNINVRYMIIPKYISIYMKVCGGQ